MKSNALKHPSSLDAKETYFGVGKDVHQPVLVYRSDVRSYENFTWKTRSRSVPPQKTFEWKYVFLQSENKKAVVVVGILLGISSVVMSFGVKYAHDLHKARVGKKATRKQQISSL